MAAHRISFGSQYKFPLKLYQVANDGLIIKWIAEGTAVSVEETEFEENVMPYYPGFVQVKTFHNLRRLFRDYGFKFQVLRKRKPYGLKLQYRHPLFTRDKYHEVLQVRKIKRNYYMHPLATSSPNEKFPRRKYLKRALCSNQTALKFDGYDSNVSVSIRGQEFDQCTQLLTEHVVLENSWTGGYTLSGPSVSLEGRGAGHNLTTAECVPAEKLLWKAVPYCQPYNSDVASNKLTEEDMLLLTQIFAKNEMSEAEFWEVVTRKCGKQWCDKSWEATLNFLTSIVNPELSLLHHKGFYYELSIDEL